MRSSKYGSLLGGMLLAAGLLLALTPAASTTLAAAKGPMSVAKVNASAAPVFSLHLASVSEACASSCAVNACPPTESEGDDNDWVAVIQWRLDNIFVSGSLTPNGNFDAATKSDVTDFQNYQGITGGRGVVGDRTWALLGLCTAYTTIFYGFFKSPSNTNCPADESNGGSDDPIYVQAIQDLLNVDYFISQQNIGTGGQNILPNSPKDFKPYLASDGSFGQLTQNAVTDFQDQQGISGGGGVVGQRTWSELGMCLAKA